MCWHWNVIVMCCTSIHVLYIHSRVLYIQLFLSQSFNPLPAHAILDEVFFICLQDLTGRPTQSLTACVNSGGTKSEKQFFLNEGFWSTESLCMTLFFFPRNCMSRTNSLAGLGLSMLFIWCAVSTQLLAFIPRSRMCPHRKLKLLSKVCSYSNFIYIYISRSALAFL